MKEMIKARKEQLQKRGVSGFTLMEMLIVVAIIAVLIAIAIPIFTAQLNNSKQAADEANARSIYAMISADYMDNGKYDNTYAGSIAKSGTVTITPEGGTAQTFTFSDVTTAGTDMTTYTSATTTAPAIQISTNGYTTKFPGGTPTKD